MYVCDKSDKNNGKFVCDNPRERIYIESLSGSLKK